MKTPLRQISAFAVACFFLMGSLQAQLFKKQQNFNYSDPNENFYVTQKRMNALFKEHEKELAREQRLKSEGKNAKVGSEEEEELGGYELYKRWENFMAPRVYPSGDKTLASKAYEEYTNYLSQNSAQKAINNSIMSNTWQPVGPMGDPSGGNAGRLNAVRFDPVNPSGIWVCAPDGGLWSSSTGGGSWNTNTDNLAAIGCSDVVFDPSNSQNMWMASGDGDAGDCYSLGVLKSTNGGLTWASTGLSWTVSQGRRIFKMIINPLNKNTIFAATSVGLYRTQNGGTSWTAVIGSGVITDVEYKPGDTTTVYACSTSFYQSVNGGTSFSTITSGLPAAATNNRLAIAVTPANPLYVYVVASASSNSGFLGFYQSTNSGTTFTSKATTPNLLGWASAGNDAGGQGWYTLAIAASPTNANEVVVGGVNIWRTTNAGTNWTLFAHWTGTGAPYVHADIHDLIYKNGTTCYAGTDGGIFFTSNSGTSFAALNGNMNIAQIYKIGNSKNTYSLSITGHQDNGTNLFTGGWSQTMGGDGMDCFIDQFNDQVMYGEQYNGSFNRTTNGGAAWTAITTGMTGTGAWVTPWHQDPVTANTIYGGRQQMFKSTNQGTNWAQIGTMPGTSQIVEFAISKSNPLVMYVIQGNTLCKTTNGGTSWTNITGTLPTGSAQLTWVTVEDDDPNSVWVTFSGYSSANKVFMSTNGGTTWTNYSTGLPNLPVNCITYWNGTKDGIYVGCDVGVYYRDSLAASWIAYNTGLPNVSVRDLAIFYPLGKLRAATFGRSVWEADLYNPGNLAPIANFTANRTFICPTMTVNFTDLSTFGPTSWNWTFQGGTPATSTAQNPAIVYNTPGTYSVALSASNVNGTSVMTKTLYITVSPTNTLPLVEGFQGATFPPTNWENYDDGSDNNKYVKSTTVGKASTASLHYDNYNLNAGGKRDEFRAPKYSFVGYTNLKCFFDVAYARYDATYSDSLEVLVSTDCGVTYTSLYLKGGTTLATAPDQTASKFVPTAAQWRTDTVYLSAYSGQSNVMVSFRNRGWYGQAMYIDNINITGVLSNLPPSASFTYAAAAPCSGQAVNFTDMSTNAPTTWSWSFPGGTPSTSSVKNPTVTYASGGSYVVTLTSSNAFGSSAPVSQTITVNATPTVAASTASANICNGQSVLLTGSGATTYSWSSGATTNTTNVTPVANTTYTVTGTTSGCSSAAVVSVTVNPSPTVTVNSTSVCAGVSSNLTASGATTYSWNTGATTAAISVTPAVTTVYTVTGTSAGCSTAKTSTVTVTAIPTVAVNSSTVCFGSSTNLTASGATTYSWNTGATTTSIAVSPTTTTVYTVTGTTSGCTNTKTSTVTVNAVPTVTATNSGPICAGSTATLMSTTATTYTWIGPGGFNSTNQNPTIVNVQPINAGTYTLIVSNASSCTTATTTALVINALPTVSSNTAAICSGAGTVTLTATGATTYTWNTGATTAAIAVSPPVTTNYTVTGTNGTGCKNSYTTTVFVSTSPTLAVNSASVCSGNAVNLTVSGATSYSWSTGATTNTVAVSPLSTTVYTVTGNTGGCIDVKTSTVTVSATPTLIVNNPSICNGGSATVTASGATTYSWNTGATTSNIVVTPSSTTVYTVSGTTGSCAGINTATVTVNTTPTVVVNSATICAGSSATLAASGASTYSWSTGALTNNIVVNPGVNTTYTVIGNNGPCSNLQTSNVVVNALPSVSLAASSSTACTAATGGVTLTLTGSPLGGTYSGTGVTGNQFNPQATAGTYNALYTYTSSTNGCVNSSSVAITVNVCTAIGTASIDNDGNIYIMPNPNNGLFTIKANIMENYDVIIYNNLGQHITTLRQNKKEVNVDLSQYGKGIYSIVFKTNETYKKLRVVVE